MQLLRYFALVRRYWMLIVALPLVVALASLALERSQPQRYLASTRIMMTQEPHSIIDTQPFPDVNLNNSWQSSQFLLDDMPQLINSAVVAEDVSRRLRSQDIEIDPGLIQGSLRAETFHRAVTIFAETDDPGTAHDILIGVVESLRANGLRYWDRDITGAPGMRISVIDPASQGAPIRNTRQSVINVAVRTMLALIAALGLAFLLHYLDDRLWQPGQIEEATGLQVLGVIPKE
ncbi:MAG: hypothetical protein HC837_00995 [Chloroflexaceae bacterium]|nr:hypothetical protein [Chloroflexaceae bacterium]